MRTIYWLRTDLRLSDNPALHWAASQGEVLPVYILDPRRGRPLGGASKWWLQQSLANLQSRIPLVIRSGHTEDILRQLAAETNATAIVWNREYTPWARSEDATLKTALTETGLAVHSFAASLLLEPWDIKEYKVFTPFWKACTALLTEKDMQPLPTPQVQWLQGIASEAPHLYPLPHQPHWANGWQTLWNVGEAAAQARLQSFLKDQLAHYPEGRDVPAQNVTSRLSPHLHFGEISPRQVYAAAQATGHPAAAKFLAELGWREFCHHLLYHYPTMLTENWKPSFDAYPWRKLEGSALADFHAWTRGETGYPLVDAGMKELWQTGYMHNRVRMVAASFLIKHLRIHWKHGENWFWDTLVDASPANNAGGWQWVAGSGADASPYFRIFNPTTQAEKFDPHQTYQKHWLLTLGTPAYPKPIVNHEAARKAALQGYQALKS